VSVLHSAQAEWLIYLAEALIVLMVVIMIARISSRYQKFSRQQKHLATSQNTHTFETVEKRLSSSTKEEDAPEAKQRTVLHTYIDDFF